MPKASPSADDYLHVCAGRHTELTSKLSGKAQEGHRLHRLVTDCENQSVLIGD